MAKKPEMVVGRLKSVLQALEGYADHVAKEAAQCSKEQVLADVKMMGMIARDALAELAEGEEEQHEGVQ